MTALVNGEAYEVPSSGESLALLLKQRGIEDTDAVSVQHNGAFVAPEHFGDIIVADGDEVEFLYFLGGGADA